MGKGTVKAADGVGFLRAYVDDMLDAEITYSGYVVVTLRHTVRRGVLEVEHAFEVPTGHGESKRTLRYVALYPNSQEMTFESFLYQCMVRLRRMLDDKYLYPSGKG